MTRIRLGTRIVVESQDGCYLVLHWKRNSGEVENDLPGGAMEGVDESPEQGVLRELLEETGIRAESLSGLKYVSELDYCFECYDENLKPGELPQTYRVVGWLFEAKLSRNSFDQVITLESNSSLAGFSWIPKENSKEISISYLKDYLENS